MNRIKRIAGIALLSFFLSVTYSHAGVETFSSNVITGIDVNAVSNYSALILTAFDQQVPAELVGVRKVARSVGRVTFGIDHYSNDYYATYNGLTAQVDITCFNKYYNLIGNYSVNLTIAYNQTGTASYTDMDVFTMDATHFMMVTVTGFLDASNNPISNPANVPKNIYLQAQVEVERYYNLPATAPAQLSHIELFPCSSSVTVPNELYINWAFTPGAEEYELEWVYVNNYKPDGTEEAAANLEYSFRNNATRVTVGSTNYTISLIYERGYIVYRVRAIGRDLNNFSNFVYTDWTTDNSVHEVDDNNYYYLIPSGEEHEKIKNWQYSASFAEEGLKKEVVTYFDGSLRNRQAVTKSNTENQTLVGETIYDYQGRPAIQVLPVPTGFCDIKFYNDFNLGATTGDPYDKDDFDKDVTASQCSTVTDGMSTADGASQYYSSNNPDFSGFQSYVPDANLYPFTQTEYTPDNTGRIRRQSGAGEDHKLGSGHETQYFYGQPEQVELDRLFGSEVGYFNHYKKNLVVDANGQVSVSYLDAKGKVIATALAGDRPVNLNTLNPPVDQLTVDYLKANDPDFPASINRNEGLDIIFQKELLVAGSSPILYTFDYDVEIPQYTDPCIPSNICYDCVYSLTISVTDQCGNEVLSTAPVPVTVSYVSTDQGPYDNSCASTLVFNLPSAVTPLTASLTTGSYTVTKTLSIDENAINYYVEDYLQNNTCMQDYTDFYNWAFGLIDIDDCDIDCDECVQMLPNQQAFEDAGGNPAEYADFYDAWLRECRSACEPPNVCQTFYETILADMRPGGQYAKYEFITTDDGITSNDPLSIFNSWNYLPKSVDKTIFGLSSSAVAWWRNPSSNYLNEDGTDSYIILVETGISSDPYFPSVEGTPLGPNSDGDYYIRPQQLNYNIDFLNYYASNPQWAEQLVQYHPEYIYYEWCSRNSNGNYSETGTGCGSMTSDDFDALLMSTTTFAACTSGTVPLILSTNLTDPEDLFKLDPYFQDNSTTPCPVTGAFGQGFYSRAAMSGVLTDYHGSGKDIKEIVARIVNCGNVYYPSSPTANPVTTIGCDVFGDPASTQLDLEWRMYRNFYLTEKRKIQKDDADMYARDSGPHSNTQPLAGSYNGCIGVGNAGFNPWAHGMLRHGGPYTINTQDYYYTDWLTQLITPFTYGYGWIDPEQPCAFWTRNYYATKTKRFPSELKNLSGSEQQQLDQLQDESDYQAFLQTGQCPSALELQFLLDKLARVGKLQNNTNPENLFNHVEFTQNLYQQISSASQFFQYYWDAPNPSSNTLTINFREGSATGTIDDCTLSLTCSTCTGTINWADVKAFTRIQFTNSPSAGTYNFKIVAWVINTTLPAGLEPIVLDGTTCIELDDCPTSFANVCPPSIVAMELQNLFNLLLLEQSSGNSSANDFTPSSAVTLSTSSSNLYSTVLTSRILQPFPGATSISWSDGGSDTRDLTYNSYTCTFSFAFNNTSGSPTMANIQYFQSIRADATDPFTFYIDAYCGTTLGLREMTVTVDNQCYDMGTCGPPVPADCNTPNHQLADDLADLLDAMAIQTGSNLDDDIIDLTNFPQLTPLLVSYLGNQVRWNPDDPTYSLVCNSCSTCTLHVLTATLDIMTCPYNPTSPCSSPSWNPACNVTLKYCSSNSTPDFDAIVRITDLQVNTSNNVNGYFYEFTCTAYLADGSFFMMEGSTSCLPLLDCVPCIQATYSSPVVSIDFNNDTYGYGSRTFKTAQNYGCEDLCPNACSGYTESQCTEDVNVYLGNGCEERNLYVGMDHTNPGTGNFFMVKFGCNNCTTAVASENIFRTSYTTSSATDYAFSFWWMIPDYIRSAGRLDLEVRINSQLIQTIAIPENAYPIHDNGSGIWHRVEVFWNSGNISTSVNFDIDVTSYIGTGVQTAIDKFLCLDDISLAEVDIVHCNDEIPPPVYIPEITYVNPCIANLQNIATENARQAWEAYLQEQRRLIKDALINTCRGAKENFNQFHDSKEHHYTLYYYDQAGNLVKTIPPEGVNIISSSTDLAQIAHDRATSAKTYLTKHTLPTTYQYNSLNQLINQATPDNANLALWNWQQSGGVASNFVASAIEFTDGCNGLMVGNASVGQVYATNDCGQTWAPVTSIGIDDLKKVQMITSLIGYAVGKDGLIVTTGDGGVTWTIVTPGTVSTNEQLNDLYFYNDGTDDFGVIVGNNGVVLTYDQTANPQWVSTQIPGYDITGIYFDGADPIASNGFVSVSNGASGDIYTTSDFGVTWAPVAGIAPDELLCIEMQTEFVGFAGGKKGALLKTTDGAQTWQALPFPKAEDIVEMYFSTSTPTSGCVILGNGDIYYTADIATGSWGVAYSSSNDVKTMSFYEPGKGYAVGTSALILTTTDGGQNWTVVTPPSGLTNDITGVYFTKDFNNNRIYGFLSENSTNKIWYYHYTTSYVWTPYTNASGVAFTKLHFPVPSINPIKGSGIASGTLYKIDLLSTTYTTSSVTFSNAKSFASVNAVQVYCVNNAGHLVSSANGGITWSTVQTTTGISNTTVNDISARTLMPKYFAVGLNTGDNSGKIYTASGTSSIAWQDNSDDVTPLPLNDIHIPTAPSTKYYVAGVNGTILKSDNGADWRTLHKYDVDNLNAIKFRDNDEGIVVGGVNGSGQGKFAVTTDGNAWTAGTATSSGSTEFTDISEYNSNQSKYYLSGKSGKVHHSDGSANAPGQINPSSITVDLNGICLSGTTPFHPMAVGNDGTILSYNGTIWSNPNTVNPPNFVSLSMLSPSEGYAITANQVYHTTTSGNDFGTNCAAISGSLTDVFCFTRNGNNYGFITTTNSTSKLYDLSSSCTWGTVSAFTSLGTALNHVFFDKTTDYKYGYVVGDAGVIYRNDNYGNASNWSSVTSPVSQNLYSVYFVGEVGYAVGAGETILKSTDNGQNWVQLRCTTQSGVLDWLTALNVTTGTALRDVYFRDQMTGYAVGDAGTVIKTIDGGATWTLRDFATTDNLYAINFSSTYGGAVGGNTEAINLTDETDLFATQFWYDELGRLVVSQNAKQANKATPAYSYTKYDVLGRINEVGEVATAADIRLLVNNDHNVIDYGTTSADAGSCQWWVAGGTRTEVTQTTYDVPTLATLTNFAQDNLRGRVAGVTVNENGTGGYDHATHYSYDIHGNVKNLVQDNPNTGFSSQQYKRTDYDYDLISGKVKEVAYQKDNVYDRFYHRYDYDADNRIIRAYTSKDNVIWDRDAQYFYYRHGPLARAEIGELRVQGTDYVYTMQGWIKGVNSNTLDNTRDPGKDATAGNLYTNYPNNIHKRIATDVYGYSLGYYDATTQGLNYNSYHNNDDYAPINTSVVNTPTIGANNFLADIPLATLSNIRNDDTDNPAADAPNLYNGNIKHMVTAIMPSIGGNFVKKPLLTVYQYDQLNRIAQMKALDDINFTTNTWGTGSTASAFTNTFTYDAMGNILTLERYDNSGTQFDELTYHYDNSGTGGALRSNKLYHVNDNMSSSASTVDIDDQGTFTAADPNDLNLVNTDNNYGYDEVGNLVRDDREYISQILWNTRGKITDIIRYYSTNLPSGVSAPATWPPDLHFEYDASGNRVAKIVMPKDASGFPLTPDHYTKTYYLRDAQGNILSTYEDKPNDANFYLEEQNIYGSSRLGMRDEEVNMTPSSPPLACAICPVYFENARGKKNYEMTNHLGNVLTTISDSREAVQNAAVVDYFKSVITSVTDYYPFGMNMLGRDYTPNAYKFGYNGKEKDDEVKSITGSSYDFGARIYDPRVGRWLSLDPLAFKYSGWNPYCYSLDNPLFYSDPDGKEVKANTIVTYSSKGTFGAPTSVNHLAETEAFGTVEYKPVLNKSGHIDIELTIDITVSDLIKGPTEFNLQNPGRAEHVLTHEHKHRDQILNAYKEPLTIVYDGKTYTKLSIDKIADKVFQDAKSKFEANDKAGVYKTQAERDKAQQQVITKVQEVTGIAALEVAKKYAQKYPDKTALEKDAIEETTKEYQKTGKKEPTGYPKHKGKELK